MVNDVPWACFEAPLTLHVILAHQMLICRVLAAYQTILLPVSHPHPPWKLREREVGMTPQIRRILQVLWSRPWGRRSRWPSLRAHVADAPPTPLLNLPCMIAHLDRQHFLKAVGPTERISSR